MYYYTFDWIQSALCHFSIVWVLCVKAQIQSHIAATKARLSKTNSKCVWDYLYPSELQQHLLARVCLWKRSIMILDWATLTDSVCVCVCVCVCVVGWISQMEGQESPDRIKPSTIWWPCCLRSHRFTDRHTLTHTLSLSHTHTHTHFSYRVLGKTAFLPQGQACGPVGHVWSCCGRTCCRKLTGRVPPHSP